MSGRTASPAELDVRVSGGVVRGVREGAVRAWRGIPYAAPPIGPLRFRSPRAVEAWTGIRDGAHFGTIATQTYRGQLRRVGPGAASGEDCLTVNVLTAAEHGCERGARHRRPHRGLPVMVFIHGGGYSNGSSQDFSGQGEGFARSGEVVYVSFNYRLGALGYLDFTRYSTADRPIESNLGLRDQLAALRWVRRNIRAFGGDPHSVTVFGESAGGNAVTTLMAMPSARGLFSRAIAQSSPADAVYSPELAARWAEEFVEILRPGASHTADAAASAITSADAAQLVTASLALQARTPDSYPGTFCLAPVVDGVLLPERPMDAFRAGRAHRVPLIIGTNDREGSIFRGRIDIIPRSSGRIRALFQRAPAPSRAPMRDAYPGLPARHAAADFGGDYAFWYPSVKVAEFHARFAPVHAYRFDIAPRLMHIVGLDATHGIEMFALSDRTDEPIVRAMGVLGGREPFSQAGERMRQHWLRFARSGAPDAGWPGYTGAERATLIIDELDRVETDPRMQRRLAWESFLPLDLPAAPSLSHMQEFPRSAR
ncbi:carboxylesterase/lipase family protein [Compostimonas suwonensis]|uniref:Carboxylic ester hydrolase n=1 Tax=Compostimonas suwonensis TaxID=1048394 RepID=A0A2M9C585_9MICO|nr:carboxylesterase/lipase family protein [Compostimonas suwonensis]PJJ65659.1 para-nitrobenzyl esterase [Compostimonas suwonensis]